MGGDVCPVAPAAPTFFFFFGFFFFFFFAARDGKRNVLDTKVP